MRTQCHFLPIHMAFWQNLDYAGGKWKGAKMPLVKSVIKVFNVYKTEYKGMVISLCYVPLGVNI